MIINHNIASLNTYHQLNVNNNNTAKSLEKLSSGLRINRAGDDAAGLAISEKMRSQIRGLDQATRNAQDGISMIQTAEGALSETHSIVQRMRELSVQAENGTLQTSDRDAIGEEMLALRTEIDRIGSTTDFNGLKLLDGSLTTQLDATSGVKVGSVLASNATVSDIKVDSAAAAQAFTLTAGTAANELTMTVGTKTQTISIGDMAANSKETLNFSDFNIELDLVTNGNAVTGANLRTDLVTAANVTTATGTSAATFAIGANAGEEMSVAFSKVDASTLGTAGSELSSLVTDNQSVSTVAKAKALTSTLDDAITQVSTQRGKFGAAQNRLEHTINNLSTASENMTAAESRIRDVDMAQEMMNYQKNNILQQAATAMLAQANQAPQGVLQLLR